MTPLIFHNITDMYFIKVLTMNFITSLTMNFIKSLFMHFITSLTMYFITVLTMHFITSLTMNFIKSLTILLGMSGKCAQWTYSSHRIACFFWLYCLDFLSSLSDFLPRYSDVSLMYRLLVVICKQSVFLSR